MEVIRRHVKSRRPGSVLMRPEERIFNPSRQTDRLLARAEMIGPHTFSLCEMWFNQEGRSGQRRMYGLVNLVRHFPARHVEKAAEVAKTNGLRSSKAIRRMVESIAAQADETDAAQGRDELTQNHPLIRAGEDYAAFWKQHAARGSAPEQSVGKTVCSGGSAIVSWDNLAQVWQRASWLRVIEVFDLQVDSKRRRRDDEIWLKSPFTGEAMASMHVSLSQNIFKDFSSGRGGGIMQFCRQMLQEQGRQMSMLQVAQWMVAEGISKVDGIRPQSTCGYNNPAAAAASTKTNPAIKIDLRRYLRADHPELQRRAIDTDTCRYLGCGFLPQRTQAKTSSPLDGRLVFQIRGVRENDNKCQPVILSHTGRALSRQQEERDGKYWSYPFRKALEIYNQDQLVLDKEARDQAGKFGLILVEGYFDVAKLVAAGCRNVGALMGSSLSAEQIQRLLWIHNRLQLPYILLFLDRDRAGQQAHTFFEDLFEASQLNRIKKVNKLFSEADLLVIDDLFLRKKMPEQAADDLLDIILTRYSARRSTVISSNRPLEDWGKLLRDNAASSAIVDRLLHRGHLLQFEGRSYRLKEASIRLAANKRKRSG